MSLPAGGHFIEPVPTDRTAFLAVYEGGAAVSETAAAAPALAVLGEGETVAVTAGETGCRFLLAAAKPFAEPIARYGPFVMTTREELAQAFEDYQAGRF